jgi:uncharacterized protein (TIGR04255 family)
MEDRKTTLPTYGAPPLVEVVFGRQFDPLPFTAAHIGLFWERLGRTAYPVVQEQPPLAPVIERLVDEPTTAVVEFADVPPLPRLWFSSDEHQSLVQLQRDRLLVNWRASSLPYPRYVTLSPKFSELWSVLDDFARSELTTNPVLRQFELTYVNHIPWTPRYDDYGTALRGIFPDLSWRPEARFLASPEGGDIRLGFRLPGDSGRLHVRVREGKRKVDGTRLFMLELTARGFQDDAQAWFDRAHEWIVRGFADLTSAEMQEQVWQRKA